MRILILSKRQYMSKDLLDDQYGRFFELPQELANLGHHVTGICLSYRRKAEGHLAGLKIDQTMVDWHSFNIRHVIFPGLFSYLSKLNKICSDFNPDIILACSDALHIIYGCRLAKRFGIPWVADLYDNFESFGLTRIPGILPFFRQAVRNADGVVCISKGLKGHIETQYRPCGITKVVQNGFPVDFFKPMDCLECRKELDLPLNARIIGTAGALGASRGIETLFSAAEELIAEDPTLHLVLAGPLEPGTSIPDGKNIHYLGNVAYGKVPVILNALDVGIICNRRSSFGRYCFPQKAYEMLACNIPVVAADVGTMSELFIDYPECLYAPDEQISMVTAVRKQLLTPTAISIEIRTWPDLAQELETLLLSCTRKVD